MTTSVQATPQGWQTFQLTRQGQLEFWDRQAQNYDLSEMTCDNEGELNLVSALCKQYIASGYPVTDIVTLGGAVGSRDPRVVLEVCNQFGQSPKSVYFNDLSDKMTDRAAEIHLTPATCLGAMIHTLPGLLHEVCKQVPTKPRRVIIGTYRLGALVTANPHHGFPLSGFREYLKNAAVVGTSFRFEPVRVGDDSYEEQSTNIVLDASESEQSLRYKERMIHEMVTMKSVDAIRVLARHPDQSGFFISHWYTDRGLKKMLQMTFGAKRTEEMSIMPCAKGYVACIDPVGAAPEGIVTILNNVVGNILPDDQFSTLKAVAKMTA